MGALDCFYFPCMIDYLEELEGCVSGFYFSFPVNISLLNKSPRVKVNEEP